MTSIDGCRDSFMIRTAYVLAQIFTYIFVLYALRIWGKEGFKYVVSTLPLLLLCIPDFEKSYTCFGPPVSLGIALCAGKLSSPSLLHCPHVSFASLNIEVLPVSLSSFSWIPLWERTRQKVNDNVLDWFTRHGLVGSYYAYIAGYLKEHTFGHLHPNVRSALSVSVSTIYIRLDRERINAFCRGEPVEPLRKKDRVSGRATLAFVVALSVVGVLLSLSRGAGGTCRQCRTMVDLYRESDQEALASCGARSSAQSFFYRHCFFSCLHSGRGYLIRTWDQYASRADSHMEELYWGNQGITCGRMGIRKRHYMGWQAHGDRQSEQEWSLLETVASQPQYHS